MDLKTLVKNFIAKWPINSTWEVKREGKRFLAMSVVRKDGFGFDWEVSDAIGNFCTELEYYGHDICPIYVPDDVEDKQDFVDSVIFDLLEENG